MAYQEVRTNEGLWGISLSLVKIVLSRSRYNLIYCLETTEPMVPKYNSNLKAYGWHAIQASDVTKLNAHL